MDAAFLELTSEALVTELQSRPEGLSEAEASERLQRLGPNLRRKRSPQQAWRQVAGLLANPLVLLLVAAASLSAAFGETLNAAIIAVIILTSIALNAIQTHRSSKAAAALRRLVNLKADVMRGGRVRHLPLAEVVPGDVFLLSAGDIIPADGLLLESKDLFVDQASLTGESLPAEKQAGAEGAEREGKAHAVFAGTSVVSGTGKAIAALTGKATAIGKVEATLEESPPPTEFERGLMRFSLLILRVTMGLVIAVFLVLSLLQHRPIDALLFSIALAVGLTPEFLPMIVSITLARGAVRMARKRVIVKQLQAIENFGSIDVLCCDKTGTLTAGSLSLDALLDGLGRPAPEILTLAALNSMHQTGLHNPLDEAILRKSGRSADPDLKEANLREPGLREASRKLDEIPFDFHRRMVSIVLEQHDRRLLIAKGAPEALIERCDTFRTEGRTQPLGAAERSQLMATFHQLSQDGLRAIALGVRDVPVQDAYSPRDETGLTFLGFLGFRDPPKPDAAEAIRTLKADGIRVIVLTGDNEWVARHVCEIVGLDATQLVNGPELDRIRDEALPRIVERTSVFARVSPEQKTRLIRALKAGGHAVGFMGDGINDAPALRIADVGISVDSAVDVAKGAASIILMDKSLRVLHDGVLEGRRSFANVIKYLMMGTSSNFGNMVSMAAAALFLPFLPMLPMQVLLNNLLYDTSQVSLAGDRVDPDALSRPRRWDIRFIQRFMLFMGPVSSAFDMLTFLLLLAVFRVSPPTFRTGWFVESLLTQTLVIFVIRTRGHPLRSKSSPALAWSVAAIASLALALPYTPLAPLLGFTPLPAGLVAALLGLTLAYLLVAQAAKEAFYRSATKTR